VLKEVKAEAGVPIPGAGAGQAGSGRPRKPAARRRASRAAG